MAEKTAQEATPKPKRCFVITPIGGDGSPERKHADWVLHGAIKPVFEGAGYIVSRADTIADPAMINDAIFERVMEDDVCIADLTFLNANVLYELGVRHALAKPVIHIAAVGTSLPFDNAQHRAIFFDRDDFRSFEGLKVQLSQHLSTIESPNFTVSNPLTHARGRQKLRVDADPRDKLLDDLYEQIKSIRLDIEKSKSRHFSFKIGDVANPFTLDNQPPAYFPQRFAENSIPDQVIDTIYDYLSASRHGSDSMARGLETMISELSNRLNEHERSVVGSMALKAGVPAHQLVHWGILTSP